MTKKTRSYSELRCLSTFEERFEYLSLRGVVGEQTFGAERYMNQRFYRSSEWRRIRNRVILRDESCDLGMEGYDVHKDLIVHHINPLTRIDIAEARDVLFDLDNLITTTLNTHNAIHYGDATLLRKPYVERTPGDTMLWGRKEQA